MCIAIWKPADKKLSRETLQTCWDANKDGAGYMYTLGDKLKVKKGFFTFNEFYRSYTDSIGRYNNMAAVIHFRIKTHGEINTENCHPYKINETLAFVHNGIISNVETKDDKTKSDTWHFNETIVKPLEQKYPGIIYTKELKPLLSEFIGHSKLIIMNNKGEISIINEDRGTWEDGIWFSNNSHKTKVIHVRHSQTDKQSYTPYYKKQISPQGMLGQGTLVKLDVSIGGLPAGAEGVVISVNDNYTANCEFFHPQYNYIKQVGRVPFYMLNVIGD